MAAQKVGVLAVQGAFAEHESALRRLGAQPVQLRQASDLEKGFDRLILPGGESTAQGRILRDLDMLDALRQKIRDGMPVLGTCAGLILLAKSVEGGTPCFETMDISVLRNAYGRQLGSFYAEEDMAGLGRVPMTFIRAPYIRSVSGSAKVLAVVDGNIVAARQGKQLVTAFHPELCDDLRVHQVFLNMIRDKN